MTSAPRVSPVALLVLAVGFAYTIPAEGQPTWNPINSPTQKVETVTVDPTDERILYVTSTETGLYVTRDGGVTWSRPFTWGTSCVALDPRTPGKVYATAYNQVLHQGQVHFSSDWGATWTLAGSFPDFIGQVLVLANGVLLAAPRNTTVTSGIYRSTDAGAHWTHHDYPTSFLQIIFWDIKEDPISGYIYAATEIANHPQPYRPPFFRSRDGGVTWEDITGTLNWHVVEIQIVNQVVYALEEGPGCTNRPTTVLPGRSEPCPSIYPCWPIPSGPAISTEEPRFTFQPPAAPTFQPIPE